MPLMNVSPWDMTDAELDAEAARRRFTEPQHADELLRFKDYRRTHPDPRPLHERGRVLPLTRQQRRDLIPRTTGQGRRCAVEGK